MRNLKSTVNRWSLALLISVVPLLAVTPTAEAGLYRVSVTRVAQDIYQDTMSRAVVTTRYCYEYVYFRDGILDFEPGAYAGRLYFGEQSSSCEVAGVAQPNASLTRVRDNLYRDELSGRFVRTSLCLALALGEESLVLDDRVIFLMSAEECDRQL